MSPELRAKFKINKICFWNTDAPGWQLLAKEIVEQAMSMAGFFSMTWQDSRLAWDTNPTYSSDIPTIFSSQSYTWFPTLVLENSVSSISIMMDADSLNLIRILSNGNCVYNPIDVYTTHCESDTTYYPFDTQECDVVIAAWGYSVAEIELSWADSGLDMSFYNENGGWEYKSYSIETGVSVRGVSSFPTATLRMFFKRRPLFQVVNTVLPCTMIAFLMVLAFKLPPDSGERMGFSLTVLLAYAVYLTIVSANLPTTSLTTSALSIYLLTTLAAGTLSVAFSIMVLRCHHKNEDDPVSPKFLNAYNGILGKFAGVKNKRSDSKVRDLTVSVVNEEEETKINSKSNSKSERVPMSKTPVSPYPEQTNDVTWPMITVFLDELFFRVFLIFTLLQQFIFISVFIIGFLIH
ncbi:acetylcholine receptor subunit beta-like [Saccostrea echinata]|uniref:acetylcholine receptor subunit beta-like n=1 Tax=Saccostrea echinata TaxID=191078 RepID=UPI002A7F9E59|nr:acetylcholine receptor subunit beta-like [Saccostrea echinata]